ncbi:MAG: hypothetical protein JST82_01400 [Bacteroidetes bacterium]|nr:hypothetical protein [Bacteroidota bacterium]
MKYTTLFIAALLMALNSYAKGDRRNTADLGIQIGGTFVSDGTGSSTSEYGANLPALNFIYDYNFDKSRSRVFFSLGARVATFSASVNYKAYASGGRLITGYSDISSIGFGIAPGINYLPVKNKNVQLRLQLCAVPMIEAGSFAEATQPNLVGEFGAGIMIKNRVGFGMRYNHRFHEYLTDGFAFNSVTVSHLMIDVRFRVRK